MKIDTEKIVSDIIAIVRTSPDDEHAKTLLEAYLIQLDVFGIKNCRQCKDVFAKITKWQKFCCEECKLAYHEAKHGKAFNPMSYRSVRNKNGLMSIPVGDGILVRPKMPPKPLQK